MNTTQILQRVDATLTFGLLDQNGQSRAVPNGLQATVTRANGSLVAEELETDVNGVGEVVVDLTAEHTADLDRFRVTLLDAGVVAAEFPVEIVGGYYFSIDEARDSSPSLNNVELYSDDVLITARHIVEEEAESICGRAFVPRYDKATLNGDGSTELTLPRSDLRRVRSLTTVGFLQDILFDVGAVEIGSLDTIYCGTDRWFPRGSRNVIVEYEYGLDAPPQRVKSAALLRLRDVAEFTKTGVSGRSLYEVVDGQVFGVARPGVRGSRTGNPEVDQAYSDWSLAHVVIA